MIEAISVIALFGGTFAFIWLGIYFGTKYIERMLLVQPPIDPNKPIVRRPPPRLRSPDWQGVLQMNKIIDGLKEALNVARGDTEARTTTHKIDPEIRDNLLASAAAGPICVSLGGVPFNNHHIEYWKQRARQAEARLAEAQQIIAKYRALP